MKRIARVLALLLLAWPMAANAQSSTKGVGFVKQAAIPWTPSCPTGTVCMWVDSASSQIQLVDGGTSKTVPSVITSAKGDVAIWNGTAWVKHSVCSNGQVLVGASGDASGWSCASLSTGTVTAVTCGAGLSCSTNPITTTGTVSLDTANANTWTATQTLQSSSPLIFKNTGGTTIFNLNTSGSQLSLYDPTAWTGFDFDGLNTNIWGKDLAELVADGVGVGLIGRNGFGGPSWNIGSTDAPVASVYGNSDGTVDVFARGRTQVRSLEANGASALALRVDTNVAWSTAGAKLCSMQNAGVEKMAVDKDGKIVAPAIGTSSSTYHALPSGTGDLCSVDATQVFSGKSISGATNTLSAIGVSSLSATGTPSSSTFLRGDNTWATPASTGNFSFSADTMDLSGAAIMSIAPTTATSISLGKSTNLAANANLTCSAGTTAVDFSSGSGVQKTTTGIFTFLSSSIAANALFTNTFNSVSSTIAKAFMLVCATAATNGTQQNSPALAFQGQVWDSGSSTSKSFEVDIQLTPFQNSGFPYGYLDFSTSLAGAAAVKQGRMGFDMGANGQGVGLASANYNGSNAGFSVQVNNNQVNLYDVNGNRALYFTGAAFYPTDLTTTFGASNARLTQSWVRTRYGVQQDVTSNGAITVNPTLGSTYKLTSNNNVTGITVSTGTYPDQTLKLILVQNAGGTDTWPTTMTNVSFVGGTFAKTLTANGIDVYVLTYDSNSTKWREVSRALNQT